MSPGGDKTKQRLKGQKETLFKDWELDEDRISGRGWCLAEQLRAPGVVPGELSSYYSIVRP